MNILGRDIKDGEILIDEDGNIWEAVGGFGMRHSARGSAILGKCEKFSGVQYISDIIDKEATEAYHASERDRMGCEALDAADQAAESEKTRTADRHDTSINKAIDVEIAINRQNNRSK